MGVWNLLWNISFTCLLASLYEVRWLVGLSVGRSVGWSVGWLCFRQNRWIMAFYGFEIIRQCWTRKKERRGGMRDEEKWKSGLRPWGRILDHLGLVSAQPQLSTCNALEILHLWSERVLERHVKNRHKSPNITERWAPRKALWKPA